MKESRTHAAARNKKKRRARRRRVRNEPIQRENFSTCVCVCMCARGPMCASTPRWDESKRKGVNVNWYIPTAFLINFFAIIMTGCSAPRERVCSPLRACLSEYTRKRERQRERERDVKRKKRRKSRFFLVRASQRIPSKACFSLSRATSALYRGCLKTACTLYARIAFIRHFSNATWLRIRGEVGTGLLMQFWKAFVATRLWTVSRTSA